MVDFLLYIMPVFILLVGILIYAAGGVKKNNKWKGVGIGIITCLIVLESPKFIEGFMEGFANGFND